MFQMLGRPDEKDIPKEKDEQKENRRVWITQNINQAPVTAC
jgi:hypothetical protein